MPFLKFPSIINHYDIKQINQWKKRFPELEEIYYIAEEKIHGTNIQTIFDIGKTMQVGRRRDLLHPGESFYDVWKTLYTYVRPLRELQKYANAEQVHLNVYWELFGPKIFTEVKYFDCSRIRLIGLRLNGILQPPITQQRIFTELGLSHLVAPTVRMMYGLTEVLKIDVDRLSWFNRSEGNIAEGVVIKPYSKVYFNHSGNPFMVKKKHPKFAEKRRQKKEKPPNSPLIDKFNNQFTTFITENRLLNIFSHHGKIEHISQLGDYIRYVLADAKADFLNEIDSNEFDKLSKAERRKVFNVGSTIANMLKKHL